MFLTMFPDSMHESVMSMLEKFGFLRELILRLHTMQSLSDSLFTDIRSYLTFRELHGTRRVAPSWQDTSKVPKILSIDCEDNYHERPREEGDFTNIRIFRVAFSPSQWNPAYYWCMQKVLQESSSSLREIHVRGNYSTEYKLDETLSFPNMVKCDLTNCDPDIFHVIVEGSPNLKTLYLGEDMYASLDFSKLTSLEHLSLGEEKTIAEIKNPHKCNITSLSLPLSGSLDLELDEFWNDCFLQNLRKIKFGNFYQDWRSNCMLDKVKSWLQKKPNLVIQSRFPPINYSFDNSRRGFCYEFGNGKLFISHYYDMGPSYSADSLLQEFPQFVNWWEKIQPFSFEISSTLEESKKQELSLLIGSVQSDQSSEETHGIAI